MAYTEAELKAIREVHAKDATDAQYENFIRECSERNLMPGRHVYFQLRSQSEKDENGNWVKSKRPIHISSIDAMRLIAQRTGQYQGQAPPVYIYLDENNFPSIKSEVMLPDKDNPDIPAKPYAVQVSVFRAGFQRPLTATARFEAYATKKFNGGLTDMWDRRGPEQLAKCCESLAIRQAFPEELAGVYIAEEFKDEPETQEILIESAKTSKKKEAKIEPSPIPVSDGVVADDKPGQVLATKNEVIPWAKKLKALGVEKERLLKYVEKKYKVSKTTELTLEQLNEIVQKCLASREKGLDTLNIMLDSE